MGGGGVLNFGVGRCEEGGYGALCPKNKGFGGPGGSQGGDLGGADGVWGVGLVVMVSSWGWRWGVGGFCAPKVGGFGVLVALRVGIGGCQWGLGGGFGGYHGRWGSWKRFEERVGGIWGFWGGCTPKSGGFEVLVTLRMIPRFGIGFGGYRVLFWGLGRGEEGGS